MRIKELLREKGITAKELASIIGMTETGLSIAMGENGNPPLKRLEQIATALGVPVTKRGSDTLSSLWERNKIES